MINKYNSREIYSSIKDHILYLSNPSDVRMEFTYTNAIFRSKAEVKDAIFPFHLNGERYTRNSAAGKFIIKIINDLPDSTFCTRVFMSKTKSCDKVEGMGSKLVSIEEIATDCLELEERGETVSIQELIDTYDRSSDECCECTKTVYCGGEMVAKDYFVHKEYVPKHADSSNYNCCPKGSEIIGSIDDFKIGEMEHDSYCIVG